VEINFSKNLNVRSEAFVRCSAHFLEAKLEILYQANFCLNKIKYYRILSTLLNLPTETR